MIMDNPASFCVSFGDLPDKAATADRADIPCSSDLLVSASFDCSVPNLSMIGYEMTPQIITAASSLLILVSGCATVRGITSDPVIVQASPQSITYRAAEGLRDEAREGAERHCEKQGRKAELVTVVPGEDTERSFTYRCI